MKHKVSPGVTLAFRSPHARRYVVLKSLFNYGQPLCLFAIIPNDACTYNLLLEELYAQDPWPNHVIVECF